MQGDLCQCCKLRDNKSCPLDPEGPVHHCRQHKTNITHPYYRPVDIPEADIARAQKVLWYYGFPGADFVTHDMIAVVVAQSYNTILDRVNNTSGLRK